jgi:hypothetical protein
MTRTTSPVGSWGATTTNGGQLTPLRVPKPLRKKLAKKSAQAQGSIVACIRQLRIDWRYPALKAKKLEGRTVDGEQVFEARATRGDRVTFYWEGPRIVIENHCKHDLLKRY